MTKTLLTPDETEVSEKSSNFTINLAIIATYTIVAMNLVSFFQLKPSFFSNKTPKNAIIKSTDGTIHTESSVK